MNSVQTTRAFFGVVVFIGMGVYPPWVSSSVETPPTGINQPVLTSQLVTKSADYSWLWEPPTKFPAARPDLIRLSIQWAAVIALFGLWVLAGQDEPPQNETAKNKLNFGSGEPNKGMVKLEKTGS